MSTILSSLSDASFHNDLDVESEDLNSAKLFGRHNKLLKILEDAYDEIEKTNNSKSVFIHGQSGTGKTSLVLALRDTVVLRRKGFFCMGKYFQDHQDPYSAIMAAFSDLCDLILQATDQERRDEIKEALGSNGQYLAKAVTNISPFLNEKPHFSIRDMQDRYILAKFKVACQTFLRAMSSDDQPIVLFLDDIQWMDAGSRDLIKTCLQASDVKNLMLIAAYRDSDTEWIKSITKYDHSSYDRIEIALENLDFDSMHEMISKKLPLNAQSLIYPLSKKIFSKTQGNPHHAIELLRSIEEGNNTSQFGDAFLLNREVLKGSVGMERKISDSFAILLSQKVMQLDVKIRSILMVASVLGYQFSKDMLFDCAVDFFHTSGLGNLTVKDLQDLLEEAEKNKFLDILDQECRFSHDKLHNAVQNLIEWDKRANLHLMIGHKFIDHPSTNAKHQAAIHLNRAFEMHKNSKGYFPIYNPKYYVKLAMLNLEASEYCQQIYAFRNAVTLLRKGLSFVPIGEKWTQHFALTFKMTKSLARMEFVVGNLTECKSVIQALLRQAHPTERMPFLMLQLEIQVAAHKVDLATARDMLGEVGITIPDGTALLRQTLRKMRKITKMIDSKTNEEILSVPCTTDTKVITATQMLMNLGGNWFLEKKTILAIFATLLAVELSLEDGFSHYSTTVLGLFGVIEVNMGKIDRAYRLAEVSLKLLKQLKAKGQECVVTANAVWFTLYKRKTLAECMCFFENVFSNAFEMCEVIHLCYSMPLYFILRFFSGDNLQDLMELTMRKMYHQLKDYGGDLSLSVSEPVMQFVLNLQSDTQNWKDLTILKGEIMDEENFWSIHSTEFAVIRDKVFFFKFLLSFLFGFYNEARMLGEQLLYENKLRNKQINCMYLSLPIYFYLTMVSYRLYDETKKRRHLRKARKYKAFLVQQHARGNPNIAVFLSIFEAIELSLRSKNVEEICNAYNHSSQMQINEGLPYLEGLVYEEAFRTVAKLGYVDRAKEYLLLAKTAYEDKWGAKAKSNWLDEYEASILYGSRNGEDLKSNDSTTRTKLFQNNSNSFSLPTHRRDGRGKRTLN